MVTGGKLKRVMKFQPRWLEVPCLNTAHVLTCAPRTFYPGCTDSETAIKWNCCFIHRLVQWTSFVNNLTYDRVTFFLLDYPTFELQLPHILFKYGHCNDCIVVLDLYPTAICVRRCKCSNNMTARNTALGKDCVNHQDKDGRTDTWRLMTRKWSRSNRIQSA